MVKRETKTNPTVLVWSSGEAVVLFTKKRKMGKERTRGGREEEISMYSLHFTKRLDLGLESGLDLHLQDPSSFHPQG